MEASTAITPTAARKAQFSIALGLFIAGVGNSFVFAVLPPIGREMGLQEIQIGSIITVSALVFMISAPLWGAKSEVWGRRRVILFGQGAYGITTLLFAITIQLRLAGMIPLLAAYGALLVFRSLFSACISGMFPASQAYMADITTRENRTRGMALIGVSIGLGMIAGPAVAALFAGFGLVLPFYAVAALAIVSGWMAFSNIVEQPRIHPSEHGTPVNTRIVKFLPFFAVSTLAMTVLAAVQQASGFYFQDKFHLDAARTAQYVGVALMTSAVCSVASQIFIVRRLGWSPARLLFVGPLVTAAGLALLLMAEHYPLFVLAMAFFGLGHGLLMPGNVAALSMIAGNHEQGRAAGLNTSAQGLGFVIGPLIGSAFYVVHPLLPYGLCMVFVAALFLNVQLFARMPD